MPKVSWLSVNLISLVAYEGLRGGETESEIMRERQVERITLIAYKN